MSKLPNAQPSPRIVNGVISWYEGDTFTLIIELDLEDQDGEPIVIGPADTVDVTFTNRSEAEVKRFSFTGIEGNSVSLVFDEEVSGLFTKGDYRYDMRFKAENNTTIAHRNNVCVE